MWRGGLLSFASPLQVPILRRGCRRCRGSRSLVLAVAGTHPFRLPSLRRDPPYRSNSGSGNYLEGTGCRSGDRGLVDVGGVGMVRCSCLLS